MSATPSEQRRPPGMESAQPGARNLGRFRSPQAERSYCAAYGDMLTLWPVPFAEHTVPRPFGETHVIASGPEAGPPLVLLHATGMSGAVWFPNVGDLSRTHRTSVIDIVGEPGLSRQTRLLRDPADCATWLLAVLDGLHVDRAGLVGSSFGGWLSINLALHESQRVDKLVLLAPAASLLPFGLFTYLLLRLLPYAPLKPGAKRVLPMYLPGFDVEGRFSRLFDLGVRGFRYANPRKSVFPRPYTDEQLHAISVPTLLLIGDRERIYDAHEALERAARLVPRIETELITGAGHILAMQHADTVDRRVLAFLHGG